jgi:hypothetical protein
MSAVLMGLLLFEGIFLLKRYHLKKMGGIPAQKYNFNRSNVSGRLDFDWRVAILD